MSEQENILDRFLNDLFWRRFFIAMESSHNGIFCCFFGNDMDDTKKQCANLYTVYSIFIPASNEQEQSSLVRALVHVFLTIEFIPIVAQSLRQGDV